ncbi:MAG: presqualene diphosphate synthase HpnD [Gemmatimonadota bacterium]|nr:presqualene diphosphate synthase HpnD [Gemmatimonadota bacterium]MDE2832760.1 presqualene diphosphate synthase HpnD [Gemmatimonadota bacterium]
MNLKRHVAKIVRGAQTNFFYAFVFLPRKKREAIFSAYAFSRHTDDIVDDAASPEEAGCRLEAWREQLHACYEGSATHPIAQNLQGVLRDFPIPKAHFLALIEGVEMDLTKNRYATFDELREYCYRVASVVGLICIEIFGYRNSQTREYAVNLGLALQLTNILRDVHTDWQQDRIYLPGEEMVRFGYPEEALARGDYNAAFVDLMRFQAQRAWDYYQKAEELLPAEDQTAMFSAQIMGKIYAQLLVKIQRANYDVFGTSVRLNNLHKLGIALRYWLGSRFAWG